MANECSTNNNKAGEGERVPRSIWFFLLYVIIFVCWLGTNFLWSYELAGPITGMTKGEWTVGVIGVFALLCGSVYLMLRRAGNGTVTATGLERENGPAIPLTRIERIVMEGGGFPAVVFSGDDQVKVHIADREFIKIAKTRLNQWTIKGKELTVEPGEARQELKISYASLGRYDTYRFACLSTFVIIIFVMALLIGINFDWDTSLFLDASIIYGICFWILAKYRKVKVSVEGDRVLLRRGKKEESFRFGDVVSMEKGLFQVKVTAKDGKIFFFPRGCILLPEIIEEFAGLAKR